MMWKRPKVFQFWCDSIKRLQKEVPEVEIIPMAVGSEGYRSRKLAERNGVIYHEVQNRPLGAKANARLKHAKELNPDYVLFLGSDDIICHDLLREYLKRIKSCDVIEVKDLYYFDTRTKKCVYCEGYTNERKGEPLAVARFVKRQVLDYFGWSVWESRKVKNIDSGFHNKLESSHFKRDLITIKDKYLVLDIKSAANISTFDTTRDNWHLINNEFFKRKTDFKALSML